MNLNFSLRVLPELEHRFWKHTNAWDRCTRCVISEWRHNVVYARGQIPCDVLFLGEAPGRDEDKQGTPFYGLSGQNVLQPMLEQVMLLYSERQRCKTCGEAKFTHDDPNYKCKFKGRGRHDFTFAITNLVACRPTDGLGCDNRPPSLDEIENCRPRLNKFILEMAKPKALVCLGRYAKEYAPEWEGLPRLDLYHPAYLLRLGGKKGPMFLKELEKLARFICREIPHD